MIIFLSKVFISLRAAYSVDVFPLPVGPVTSKIPLGFLISLLKAFKKSSENPKFCILIVTLLLSSIRITTFSP